ncbi:BA14K family protein [Aureimonas pseudogalii]|uniref:Lectin-like protein BA14k n=1 Tax=Aureimonas pseudogalii TaxID=1744844 RepID=A0A7W6EFH6_9HYPH|nr:BA14K family protein [Aureimonas pseudogalii]MBB3998472.1 hypothetical protein [Aureimonas pseudogalii]
MGWKSSGLSLAMAALIGAASALPASAGEYLGLDPYNRPIFAEPGPFPVVPSRVSGPHYRRTVGQFGGPSVAGPLYYAEPAPPVSGFYRPDPAVEAGSILAFDSDSAFARAERTSGRFDEAYAGRRPPPFSAEWYRDCAARYRSFDRDSGTFQPDRGPRRLCR